MDTCIRAEGGHAVTRYKSYKSEFLKVIRSGILPDRKYKHAMPLYRIAQGHLGDASILMGLHTVFRFYDLYTPTQSQIEKDLGEFVREFIVPELRQQDHSYSIRMEDEVFDFKVEVQQVVQSRAFRSFASKVPFSEPFKPQEKAILLSKHGTASFKRNFTPKRVKGFAPSIVGATAELRQSHMTRLTSGESYYDLLVSLGNSIGNYSLPSMTFKYVDIPPSGNLDATLRRTVAFGNPGFKTRVIAIADYTSQYVLSPLHSWAFNVLRSISSDYTFDHKKGFQTLSEFTHDKGYVACFDLSKATDALPVTLSECVLSVLLPNGAAIAPLWRRVLTELPFDKGYYRVGQPMGLMSSWSIGLALTHHFVVWIAASRAGILDAVLKNPKGFYGMVGDDIFIVDHRLAFWYSNIMNALGVKINLTKSLIVFENDRVSEFVKRNSLDGCEITALSPTLIVKSFDDYVCLRELILYIRARTMYGPMKDTSSSFDEQAVVDLYKRFGSDFIRSSISTMCSIPAEYAGLADLKAANAQWPPKLRVRLLVEKALILLEYKVKSIYINATGNDTFNELVNWSLEDLVSDYYFPKTQFVEYLRKQSLEALHLFGGVDLEQNHLMAMLALRAYEVLTESISDTEFFLWEEEFLTELSSYSKLPSFSTIEAQRKETRSLAYKVSDLVRNWESKDFQPRERITKRMKHLLRKFTFELPSSLSREEMYEHLFSEQFAEQE